MLEQVVLLDLLLEVRRLLVLTHAGYVELGMVG